MISAMFYSVVPVFLFSSRSFVAATYLLPVGFADQVPVLLRFPGPGRKRFQKFYQDYFI